MKKIIISGIALITLTSCGAPKIDSPADALSKNQSSIISNIEKFYNNYPKQGKDEGNIKAKLSSKDINFDINLDYKGDFKERGRESNYNLKLKAKADIQKTANSPEQKLGGKIDLNLITLTNKIYFKLNSIDIDEIEKNPQFAMVSGIVAPFQKKWFFLDLPKDSYSDMQKNILKNLPEILKNLKKETIFKFVKENKNKDFYDYDIVISDKAIINISKQFNKIAYKNDTKKQELSKQEIENIKKSIEEFNKNVKLNIKIDKSDLQYFIFNMKNKDGDFNIENTKNNFNLVLNNKIDDFNIELKTKKLGKKNNGKLIIKQKNIEVFNGIINTTISKNNFEIKIDGIVKKDNQELKINLELKDKVSNESVKIEEPKDAKDFQKVVNQILGTMMGGIAPGMQTNSIGNTNSNIITTNSGVFNSNSGVLIK